MCVRNMAGGLRQALLPRFRAWSLAASRPQSLQPSAVQGPAPGTVSPSTRPLAWVLLAAVFAITCAVRWRLLSVPLERDEGEYAYIGQLLLRGIAPFRYAYSMKLPGTPAIYAAFMSVFGESIEGVRAGVLLVNLGTIILVFLLGRSLLGTVAGVASAAAQATLSISVGLLGPFGHATHFVALFAVAGLLVLLRRLGRPGRPWLAAAGLLLGMAPLMKQAGALFPLLGVVWLMVRRRSRPDPSWRGHVADQAALIAGIAVPLAATFVALGLAGTLQRSWFWTVDYAMRYASAVPLRQALPVLWWTASRFLRDAPGLWAMALAGLLALCVPACRVPHGRLLLSFLAFSAAGVCPGLHFRPHYFLLALPAVSLLVGAVVHAAGQVVSGRRGPQLAGALVALTCGQALHAQRTLFFHASPESVSRAVYGGNPFPESLEIARFIRENSGPDDRIVVAGSEPQIYFYSRRLSGTGFIYTYGLMEEQPFAAQMQADMIREIEEARARMVVFVAVPTSWLVTPRSDRRIFQWLEEYLGANYEVVGRVVILGPDRTEYYWGEQAQPARLAQVVVYQRRRSAAAP